MSTTTVPAGAKGVDFSFAKPPPARLRELGYSFVVGYLSVPPANAGKNLTKAQCQDYLRAGLSVILVWEMSADTPNQGATRGHLDGTNARTLAHNLGYPTSVPIIAAVDTNTTGVLAAAHEGYCRAFARQCAPYPLGIYGDDDILRLCRDICQLGWLPNAWAWSSSVSRADAVKQGLEAGMHVEQRTGFHIDNQWAVDPNLVHRPFLAWNTTAARPIETPSPPSPIATPEDPMFHVTNEQPRIDPRSGVEVRAGAFVYVPQPDGTLRHADPIEGAFYAKSTPVPYSNADLDAWLEIRPQVDIVRGGITLTGQINASGYLS